MASPSIVCQPLFSMSQNVGQEFEQCCGTFFSCCDPLPSCNIIYIYKEELRMVVRELLACTQPNRHETFTALWNPYHRVSSRGRRAQIRFNRGAHSEKPENDHLPFWFYRESIRTSMHGSHIVDFGSAIIGKPSCVFRFLWSAIAVEARRRRAASASILYIYTVYKGFLI